MLHPSFLQWVHGRVTVVQQVVLPQGFVLVHFQEPPRGLLTSRSSLVGVRIPGLIVVRTDPGDITLAGKLVPYEPYAPASAWLVAPECTRWRVGLVGFSSVPAS